MSDTDPTATSMDGRRARRERGRLAVLDALVDLVREQQALPPAEVLAKRAGVSTSSLFRYFETLDDLREQGLVRFLERFAPLFEIDDLGVGSFDERTRRYVAARIALYEAIAPASRFGRARALDHPEFAATISDVRHRQADQCRTQFAHELEPMTAAARDDVVALVCTVTSFEAWDQQRDDLGRTSRQVQRAWLHALRTLLS